MQRRTFIGTTTLALAAASLAPKCSGPSIEAEIAIINTTITALKPLLPNLTSLLDTIQKVANDFNTAYKRGDFASARALLDSLDSNITVLLNDIGAGSPRVKFLAAVVSIALHAVSALFLEHATPAITAAAAGTGDRVKQLGSETAADKLLKSLRQ